MILGLTIILVLVLILPFLLKKVEEELEIFLFIMGLVSVSITYQWSWHLVKESLLEPVKITVAVFLSGLLFKLIQNPLHKNLNIVVKKLGLKLFVFLLIVVLGMLSSIITAIISALILVEMINFLKLDKKTEIKIVVLTCFSIGLGAALTPIGEPLSTIAIAKLKDKPYNADFFFLTKTLGVYITSAIIILGIIGTKIIKKSKKSEHGLKENKLENFKDIFIRTLKVYLFVMALILLGTGFKPIIDMYLSKVPFHILYWINIISAVLDNATLTAAEIGPSLSLTQIKFALLGLIISGGILIPGNIPNIISANKLKIKSKEWAKIGIPVGLSLMIVYFILLILI
jgi:predicted cation transporter